MTEMEKKVLLTQEEYLALLKRFHLPESGTIQTNHYYDTDDLALKSAGITCRVREKNGKMIATRKSHSRGSDISEEVSMTVENVPAVFPFGNVYAVHKGELSTQRAVLSGNGVDICLDKNSYLGTVDYELELEYLPGKEDMASKLMLDIADYLFMMGIISSWNRVLCRVGNGKSKSASFFDRLISMKTKRGLS